MNTFGFIGGGRIVRILCKGFLSAGSLPSAIVYDSSSEALQRISADIPGVKTTAVLDEVIGAHYLILAVHPQAMIQTAEAVRGKIAADTVVLSLSPKIGIAKLQELLGGHNLVARMNPNAPSLVNRGFNPVAFSDGFDEQKKSEVLTMFSAVGKTPVVEDRLIDAFAVITAMGATYLDYQLAVLKDMASSFGIPSELADEGILTLAEGIAETVLRPAAGENPLDLVPVRPLKELEEQVTAAYRTRLQERFDMLTK